MKANKEKKVKAIIDALNGNTLPLKAIIKENAPVSYQIEFVEHDAIVDRKTDSKTIRIDFNAAM